MSDLRFAWFAPHAGLWVSYVMEHRVANALVDQGHEVLMIQCDGVLSQYCQVMSAAHIGATDSDADKQAVCRECRFSAGLARDHARYQVTQLSEWLTNEDWMQVEEVLAGVNFGNWREVEAGGIPIGLYSAYTALIHHKVAEVSDTAEAWAEYLSDLRGALLVAAAAPRLCDAERPTHAVVFNALYPANRAFAETLRRRGSILLNVTGGASIPRRYSSMMIFDGFTSSQTGVFSEAFQQSMQVPCSALEIHNVEEHVTQLMAGTDPWVYSQGTTGMSATAIRVKLGVRPKAPIATIVLPSLDERRSYTEVDAVYTPPGHRGFSEVPEFLEQCIALAVRHPEVDFVLRLHPRLVPNKRDRITSPDLEAIYRLLDGLPSNCVVNHPSDHVSLYDLLIVSDLAINSSSSAGLEFLTFGLPVVHYDPASILLYPRELPYAVDRLDQAGFDEALDSALAQGFDLERSIAAIRWYATWHLRAVLSLDPISDPITISEVGRQASPPPSPRPHPLGRLLPTPIKIRIAAHLQRRQRASQIDDSRLDIEAQETLSHVVQTLRSQGEVWEPPMRYPAESDPVSERVEVHAALVRLSSRLNLQDAEGLGALRLSGLT